MSNNNDPSPSFTQAPENTPPAGMSSFFATQTFFTTPTQSLDSVASSAATSQDATTGPAETGTTSPSKAATAGRTTSTRSPGLSGSTAHTSPSQTSSTENASNTLTESPSPNSIISPTGSTLSTSFTSAAAASATSGLAGVSEAKSCTGMCSPGMQAAVAVPVTLIALGIIIAFIFFARRRRRGDSESALSNGEPRGSKWARHLRVFSFDAELLIGGRSSRATSVRSQPTPRSHPSQTSLRSQQPSIRTLESPAPPYRDALAAGGQQMAMRPDSQLTAPPPYIADRASHQDNSRLSAISRSPTTASDPFADPDDGGSEIISPISGRSIIRRSSYRALGADVDADDISFVSSRADGPEEIGSVRQAEVARQVSGARRS